MSAPTSERHLEPVVSDDGRPVELAVVDYGMGNRRSVEKALEHAGAHAVVTDDPDRLRRADGLVLCGVGAFAAGAARLAESGLDELVRSRVDDGVPLLGICLGMQLLFERSEERGGGEGLGLLAGPVRRLEPEPGMKLPHIGWNLVRWTDARAERPALRGDLPERTAFYHVHSYVAHPEDPADAVAHGDYGGPFVTAVQRGRVLGAQFHPEKSSTDGLRVLRSFAASCARSTT